MIRTDTEGRIVLPKFIKNGKNTTTDKKKISQGKPNAVSLVIHKKRTAQDGTRTIGNTIDVQESLDSIGQPHVPEVDVVCGSRCSHVCQRKDEESKGKADIGSKNENENDNQTLLEKINRMVEDKIEIMKTAIRREILDEVLESIRKGGEVEVGISTQALSLAVLGESATSECASQSSDIISTVSKKAAMVCRFLTAVIAITGL